MTTIKAIKTTSIDCRSLGLAFLSSKVTKGVANSADIYFLIEVGADNVKMGYSDFVSGDFYAEIREGASVTAKGTALDAINLNRARSDGDGVIVYHGTPGGANILDSGDQLAEIEISGGSGIFTRGGGSSRGSWILKANTTYLIHHTNDSGATGWIAKNWQWSKC